MKQYGLVEKTDLKKLWRRLDYNGNNVVSLAEIDKMVVELVAGGVWPSWLNNKPALMRAYKKTILKDGDGDDWVEKKEFHALLLNIFWFNKIWVIFDEMDTGRDRRLDFGEFQTGMSKLGLSLNAQEAQEEFAKIDSNRGGQVLFVEFCAYVRQRVNPDAHPDFDADIVSGEHCGRARYNTAHHGHSSHHHSHVMSRDLSFDQTQLPASSPYAMSSHNDSLRSVGSSATLDHHVRQKCFADFDRLEDQIKDLCRDHQKLRQMWSTLDYNGNGIVSLAEIDKWIVENYELLNHKPALMRCYKCTMGRDEWVHRRDFKKLIVNLFYFNKLYWIFDECNGDDRRMTVEEFRQCLTLCQVRVPDVEAEFRKIDMNGGGIVLFDEFCHYFARKACPQGMTDFVDDGYDRTKHDGTSGTVGHGHHVKYRLGSIDNLGRSHHAHGYGHSGHHRIRSRDLTFTQDPPSHVDTLRAAAHHDSSIKQGIFADFDALEDHIKSLCKNHAELSRMWSVLDFNGNNIVSLAEIDKWVVENYPLLNHKPALMRCYKCTMEKDQWVHRRNFKRFILNVFYFNKLFWIFDHCDGDDRRITQSEFRDCLNFLNVQVDDPDAEFRKIDKNGGGIILFDEFCHYFCSDANPAISALVDDGIDRSHHDGTSGTVGHGHHVKYRLGSVDALGHSHHGPHHGSHHGYVRSRDLQFGEQTQSPSRRYGTYSPQQSQNSFYAPSATSHIDTLRAAANRDTSLKHSIFKDFDDLFNHFKDLCSDPREIKKIWSVLDFNGNNIVSLAEIDKWVVENYPLLNHKPALMRCYKCTMERDEWLHRRDFKKFLLNVFYFNKLFWIFDHCDGDDRRITPSEFRDCLNFLNVQVDDPDAEFRKIDKNGGGIILFDEFCHYFCSDANPAISALVDDGIDRSHHDGTSGTVGHGHHVKYRLGSVDALGHSHHGPHHGSHHGYVRSRDLQFGEQTQSPSRRYGTYSPQQSQNSFYAPSATSHIDTLRAAANRDTSLKHSIFKDFDDLFNHFKDLCSDPREIKKIWSVLDFNGNNIVSLAEIDKWVVENYPLLNHKPALMRCYKCTMERDEWLHRRDFKKFLLNVFYFNKLFWIFDHCDGDDRRITPSEFRDCLNLLGVQVDDPDAEFRKMDKNGGGIVLFDEFCHYFAHNVCPAMSAFVDDGFDRTTHDGTEGTVNGHHVKYRLGSIDNLGRPTHHGGHHGHHGHSRVRSRDLSFDQAPQSPMGGYGGYGMSSPKSRVDTLRSDAHRDTSIKQSMFKDFDDLEAHLKSLCSSNEQIRKIWTVLDFNGNNIVSLAEIDKWVVENYPLLNHKPALMRCYKCTMEKDEWVHRRDFKRFLLNVFYFNKLFWIFDHCDGDDRRINQAEFRECLSFLGVQNVDPDEEFRKVDKNGGGIILFDEFCHYFTSNVCPQLSAIVDDGIDRSQHDGTSGTVGHGHHVKYRLGTIDNLGRPTHHDHHHHFHHGHHGRN
eukprot:TRINITY_DN20944_c0_g1_i4.p1 TRINITY_DN20944_c0_g1~~TRINITY_DN20944_c0_g1_i4.p1  ORF type:complete len:1624 (-),score=312.37 TRINITY_DN20944_c0_g1_i4:138-4550(-)